MSITTESGYIAAPKQRIPIHKTVARTTVAVMPFSMFDIAGNPGAGVLAVGNTANGIVPTPGAVAGYPVINTFGVGSEGKLTRFEFFTTVASRAHLYDRLFSAGAYAFNASVTLTAQPSFVSRLPGSSYNNLEIWVEQVTPATGNQAVTVTYTSENGSGRSTGAVGIGAAPTLGRMWQLPLQAGDREVRLIESVTGTIATVGTFNIHVMRRLASARAISVGGGEVQDWQRTGAPIVYVDSAFFVAIVADSTSSGIPEVTLEVANG